MDENQQEAVSPGDALLSTPVEVVPVQAAEPKTFEQRVEDRFVALERAVMGLPHSIAHVMHQGSMEAEEFAKRVIAHLFGTNQ